MTRLLILSLFVVIPVGAFAHSGRTNSEGCHNNTKTGGYHCHNSEDKSTDNIEVKKAKTEARAVARSGARDYNCSDFVSWEEAQATYERAGGPLIDPYDLDRDRDEVACEALM